MRWLAVFFLALPLAAAAEDFPRGQLIEKVVTRTDPEQSYALYIPTSYQPDRKWPILYVFDARANGVHAGKRFVAGAEKYGYLVASSNNSASDGPIEPNFVALRRMWTDTQVRFSIDHRRVYAAGFSGTVRSSILSARAAPGTIAGVIAAGAGFPFGNPPTRDDAFLYYGTVGNVDYNYYEVLDVAEQMTALGLPNRVEVFAGRHDWMSEELATRAFAWLEIQAMKKGLRDKDAALIERIWADDLARARALEATDILESHRLYSGMAEDYRGLVDAEILNELALQISRVAASDVFRKQRKLWQEVELRDKQYLAMAPKAMSTASVDQAVHDLQIEALKKKAKTGEPQESLSAKRLLNALMGQTAFYLPRQFTEQGNHERAAFVLGVAVEIAPDNAEIWYGLAVAQARKGSKKRALESLRKAIDLGLSDLGRLEKEPAFASLRQEKGYRELVSGISN